MTVDLAGLLPTDGLTRADLRLRPVRVADAEWLVRAGGDEDVVRFTDIADAMTVDAAVAWLERRCTHLAEGWRASFVVEDGGAPAGYLNLRINWGLAIGAVGYWLLAEHRGRGVMNDAVRLVRDWAFDVVGIARLEAEVQPENAASIAVCERLGFQREGLRRSSDVVKGVRHDQWMFSLLPSDPRR